MDNETLMHITQNCCPTISNKCFGIVSANNFFSDKDLKECYLRSLKSLHSSFFFQIVNTSKAGEIGQHWLLVCLITIESKSKIKPKNGKREASAYEKWLKEKTVCVWDCLGQDLSNYANFNRRLQKVTCKVDETFQIKFPLQNPSSNLCGLYCLYMAHNFGRLLDNRPKSLKQLVIQCFAVTITEIDLVKFFNSHCMQNFKYILY